MTWDIHNVRKTSLSTVTNSRQPRMSRMTTIQHSWNEKKKVIEGETEIEPDALARRTVSLKE